MTHICGLITRQRGGKRCLTILMCFPTVALTYNLHVSPRQPCDVILLALGGLHKAKKLELRNSTGKPCLKFNGYISFSVAVLADNSSKRLEHIARSWCEPSVQSEHLLLANHEG